MTSFEIYVFLLCFIVFLLLTAMFTYLLASITKMEIELIQFGHRDENIKKQLNKKRKENKIVLWVNRGLSLLLCLVFVTVFSFATYMRITEQQMVGDIPSIKVVKSESMSEKNSKNKYLFNNNINNQFQMFDIVMCEKLPAENELKLYDVVVYERDEMQIIHRIVHIEEPNEQHPNERLFILQGDAIDNPDTAPVSYSQMRGIYSGSRIPFVGSFVLFLQSPAGWLCVLLVIFSMVATPIVEKRVKKEIDGRVLIFNNGAQEEDGNE